MTQASLLSHQNNGLFESLKIEQQKRKRGKSLDLSGELDFGTVLYSPAKVVRCRVYQAEKDTIQAEKDMQKRLERFRQLLISL